MANFDQMSLAAGHQGPGHATAVHLVAILAPVGCIGV